MFFFLIGCHDKHSNEQLEKFKTQKNIEDQNIALAKQIWAEGDNRNLDFLDEVCTSDYKCRFPSNSNPINREEHKKLWQSFNEAFPNLTHIIEEIYASDDIVVARITISGTHKGEFTGIPPTGKEVKFGAIEICRFSNNKFAEFWADADVIGLYQQLGMELKMKEENE